MNRDNPWDTAARALESLFGTDERLPGVLVSPAFIASEALEAIPNGWAKIDGRFIRLDHATVHALRTVYSEELRR